LIKSSATDTPRKTARKALDFYPTPEGPCVVLRRYLEEALAVFQEPSESFLDPAAGAGDLIRVVRDCAPFGEAHWTAIELDAAHLDALEGVADNVVIGDALCVVWPAVHVVANPPFSLLDEFWQKAVAHRDLYHVFCAIFTPCAWWHAEKRWGYTFPDVLLALGWRPVFHPKDGPAHKGSQDFVWSILAPFPAKSAQWLRCEKP
jgi:hypothetical protein